MINASSHGNVPFIIFLHIMKSGGMTLQRMLRERYGPTVVSRAGRFARHLVAPVPRANSLAEALSRKRPQERWATGHFCYGVHDLLPRPFTYITLLRHPVERLVSLYYYSKHEPHSFYHRQARDVSLDKFLLETKLHELDNGQLRVIVGGSTDYFTNRTPRGECSEQMLQTAQRHIEESFCVAGVTERFDETVLLLGKTLGWKSCRYLRRNKGRTTAERKTLDPVVRAEVQQRNELDYRLYDWVRGRLEAQIAATGPALMEELARLRAHNLRYNRTAGPFYDVYERSKLVAKRMLSYRGYHHSR